MPTLWRCHGDRCVKVRARAGITRAPRFYGNVIDHLTLEPLPPYPPESIRVFAGRSQPTMRARMVYSQQESPKVGSAKAHAHSFYTFFSDIMVFTISLCNVGGCFFCVSTSKQLVKSDNTLDCACYHHFIPEPNLQFLVTFLAFYHTYGGTQTMLLHN